MFRGVLTFPVHVPNPGLAISVSNAVEPKHRVVQTKMCWFQALKNSAWKRKPTLSVIGMFLIMLISVFENLGPRSELTRGPSPNVNDSGS